MDSETSKNRARGVLREIARKRLPEWVLAREGEKRSLPISAWLRGPLSSVVGVLLGDGYLRRQGLFDPRTVQALLGCLRTGDSGAVAQVWRLMAFQLWYLIFIEDEELASSELARARRTDHLPARAGLSSSAENQLHLD